MVRSVSILISVVFRPLGTYLCWICTCFRDHSNFRELPGCIKIMQFSMLPALYVCLCLWQRIFRAMSQVISIWNGRNSSVNNRILRGFWFNASNNEHLHSLMGTEGVTTAVWHNCERSIYVYICIMATTTVHCNSRGSQGLKKLSPSEFFYVLICWCSVCRKTCIYVYICTYKNIYWGKARKRKPHFSEQSFIHKIFATMKLNWKCLDY